MRTASISIAAILIAGLAAPSQAREIYEDFICFCGGPIFDIELDYDFGTDSDFSGGTDTWDLFTGELYLYPELVNITVNSLAAGEYIDSIEVMWTDFCGIGCTELEVIGANGSVSVSNSTVSMLETVTLTRDDLGEDIESFSLSSFEGRIEEFRVTVLPTPGTLALLGLGGLFAIRRQR